MSDAIPARMESDSRPVRLLGAVAATAVAAPSALAVIPGVPGWVAAAVGAFGLLLTIGLAKYTGDSVTPWKDVVAKQTPSGKIVSGPADDNNPTGATVTVVADASPPKFQPGGTVYDQTGDRKLDPFEEDLNNG